MQKNLFSSNWGDNFATEFEKHVIMTRGIRNNNPLNIRKNALNNWQGKVWESSDEAFEQFDSMINGYRAALRLIERYIVRYKLSTPRLVIYRWAPPDENDTEGYIRDVCRISGLGGNENLTNTGRAIKSLVWAMSVVECGKDIYDYKEYLDKAWEDFIPTSMALVRVKDNY